MIDHYRRNNMSENLERYLDYGSISVSGFLLQHFAELGMNPSELVIFLELVLARSQGNLFPSAKKLSQATGISENDIYNLLHQLVSKNIISISSTKSGEDEYKFNLLNSKIDKLIDSKTNIKTGNRSQQERNKQNDTVKERKGLFKKIQEEFGRPLSSIELEMINQWIDQDHYSPEIIELALKESVLSQVYSLKYMDRILLNWQHQNIKTAAQVQQANERRQKGIESKNKRKPNQNIPIFKIDNQR